MIGDSLSRYYQFDNLKEVLEFIKRRVLHDRAEVSLKK